MEIKNINVDGINVRTIGIPDLPEWLTSSPPQAIPIYPPVTQQVGVPIVDMPGCVEAHESNNDKNQVITSDDPKGVKVYCDAGMPSYNPINYNPDELEFTGEAQVPPIKSPPAPEVPKAPEIPKEVSSAEVKCPTEAQQLKEPVGTLTDGGTKKIVEYRLVGVECIPVKENINIPDQIVQAIPTAGAVTTTASIAVVATTSALLAKPLADILLKVVKPTVKKVIKKIATIRGKSVPVQSLKDRQAEQRLRNHAVRKLKGKE